VFIRGRDQNPSRLFDIDGSQADEVQKIVIEMGMVRKSGDRAI
jgi:hypothetical protein